MLENSESSFVIAVINVVSIPLVTKHHIASPVPLILNEPISVNVPIELANSGLLSESTSVKITLVPAFITPSVDHIRVPSPDSKLLLTQSLSVK